MRIDQKIIILTSNYFKLQVHMKNESYTFR